MAASDLDPTLEDLAAASPVLARALASVREEWAPDAPPPTIVMGELGSALIDAIEGVDDDELARVAAAIERALEHGSKLVKDAVATGLIEAAMTSTDADPRGARFLRKLGALGLKYARDWDQFGGRRTAGVWDEPADA
jgi:hypothetical protein